MDFLKQNKTLLIGLLVAGLCIFLYFRFAGGGGGEAPLLSATETSPVSQELLETLRNLNTLTLDPAIFKDPVFLSLSDFGVTLTPGPVGRRNPFAPVGATSGAASQGGAPAR